MLCLPPLGLVTTAVEGYSFSRPRSFSCILVSSEVSHLIATLVKRLWLSYTTGLHIPATRWIWICLARNPRTAAAHVPYAVLITTTPAQVTVSTRGVI